MKPAATLLLGVLVLGAALSCARVSADESDIRAAPKEASERLTKKWRGVPWRASVRLLSSEALATSDGKYVMAQEADLDPATAPVLTGSLEDTLDKAWRSCTAKASDRFEVLKTMTGCICWCDAKVVALGTESGEVTASVQLESKVKEIADDGGRIPATKEFGSMTVCAS